MDNEILKTVKSCLHIEATDEDRIRSLRELVRLLAQHYVHQFAKEFRKPINRIDDSAYDKLMNYAWPGNVRELRNVTERAVLLSKSDTFTADDCVLGRAEQTEEPIGSGFVLPDSGIDLHALEESLVRQAIERTNNDQAAAANLLMLGKDALRFRLERYGLR